MITVREYVISASRFLTASNLGWSGPKVMRVGEQRGRGFWRPARAAANAPLRKNL